MSEMTLEQFLYDFNNAVMLNILLNNKIIYILRSGGSQRVSKAMHISQGIPGWGAFVSCMCALDLRVQFLDWREVELCAVAA